jgi:hypothetical protein
LEIQTEIADGLCVLGDRDLLAILNVVPNCIHT